MLYQRQFGPGMQLTKVYLIHEGTDKENTAAGSAQQVLLCERIGHLLGNESPALICNGKNQSLAGVLEAHRDLPGRIVFVAVENGVDGRLPNRHGHVKSFVFVQASLSGHLFGSRFNLVDAFHCRAQPETPSSWPGFGHRVCLPPSLDWPGNRPAPFLISLAGSFMAAK